MRHIRPTTKKMPVPALTLNPVCVPCMVVSQAVGKQPHQIEPKCEAKLGESCWV